MKKTILFAIDEPRAEILVSESAQGSNAIQPVARIPRNENPLLYDAVSLLTRITEAPDIDTAVFKAMDKVCELMWEKMRK
jgi:hypothetical protein